MKLKTVHIFLLAGLFVVFVSCSNKEPSQMVSKETQQNDSSIWLENKPEQVRVVSEIRGTAPGTEVVVEGVIGGVVDPLSASYAVFVIADDELVFCNEMGDDHCDTPWDACCEDIDKRLSSLASVQIMGPEGFPLELSLRDEYGLKELDKLVVRGVVAENSTDDNLIITATGIFRDPS